ncbi:SMODS domain-containing nucleotidyltransferase [Undibacterium sp. Rencai35W]|uniref:SMODS domain-containing nucleotidyltransferase n=1 Tax=Undibacterium sp. Rencai35W TaxID=3413046 RepID=UPI003BF18A1E
MSVISYLEEQAKKAVMSQSEDNSIQTSILTLKKRLHLHFGDIREYIQFGSSTRGTILPRSMDEHSDIDLMVVFNDSNVSSQTYLDRLRKFVEKYYKKSEVRQSHPTILLELNHIRFELVPARYSFWWGYEIPNIDGNWQSTDPVRFNKKLTEKNKNNDNLIKPTIRLIKYWNARNGYVFNSYSLEKNIVEMNYLWIQKNQRDYLYRVFDKLDTDFDTKWRKNKMDRAKKIIEQVKFFERTSSMIQAEKEIRKLIPDQPA